MSLGPVFASCSPTYALILATVLPQNFWAGFIYLVTYSLGLGLIMLLIAVYGQRIITNLKWAANPHGWFKRVLGVALVIVGLAVISGVDRTIEKALLNSGFLDVTKIELALLQNAPAVNKISIPTQQLLNVEKPVVAPEITGINHWINSSGEKLADLKGKVVIIDFWTYSCINCIRTIPYLNDWYAKYKDKGLVIIGIHSPEFAFEREIPNVEKAIKDYKIEYPVGMDNDFATWNAYNNQYWPAKYFIDKNGLVRHVHFGEGDDATNERVIQFLLAEGGTTVNTPITTNDAGPAVRPDETPETYLGYERMQNFASPDLLQKDKVASYTFPQNLQADYWALSGQWQDHAMDLIAKENNCVLKLNFSAKEVYLVMSAPTESDVSVKVNGKSVALLGYGGDDVDKFGVVKVKDARLYRLVKLPEFQSNLELELTFPANVSLNAFTFGS